MLQASRHRLARPGVKLKLQAYPHIEEMDNCQGPKFKLPWRETFRTLGSGLLRVSGLGGPNYL